MKTAWLLPLALLLCTAPRVALAHGGGLDANGGHVDHRTGLYHYHGGGGGFSAPSFGFGGLGTAYSPPSPRRRARTTARLAPRTAARTTAARQDPFSASVTVNAETETGAGAPPSSPEDREQQAEELLRLAKLLARQGKTPGAVNYLKELTTKYPGTKAAVEGAKLLKTLTAGGP